MPSDEVKVRFTGNASEALSAFQQVNAKMGQGASMADRLNASLKGAFGGGLTGMLQSASAAMGSLAFQITATQKAAQLAEAAIRAMFAAVRSTAEGSLTATERMDTAKRHFATQSGLSGAPLDQAVARLNEMTRFNALNDSPTLGTELATGLVSSHFSPREAVAGAGAMMSGLAAMNMTGRDIDVRQFVESMTGALFASRQAPTAKNLDKLMRQFSGVFKEAKVEAVDIPFFARELSALMDVGNVSLEQAMGMFVAVRKANPSAREAGTAFKGLAARFRKEPSPEILRSLAMLGINPTQFRDMSFEEQIATMRSARDRIGERQFAKIAPQVGGEEHLAELLRLVHEQPNFAEYQALTRNLTYLDAAQAINISGPAAAARRSRITTQQLLADDPRSLERGLLMLDESRWRAVMQGRFGAGGAVAADAANWIGRQFHASAFRLDPDTGLPILRSPESAVRGVRQWNVVVDPLGVEAAGNQPPRAAGAGR